MHQSSYIRIIRVSVELRTYNGVSIGASVGASVEQSRCVNGAIKAIKVSSYKGA